MSIIVSGVSYILPGGQSLIENLSFTVSARERASLVGDNGTGKTTLLHLLAGRTAPSSGEISVAGRVYYVPQCFAPGVGMRICDVLGVGSKVDALDAICRGRSEEDYFTTLGDDWNINERISAALDRWGLSFLSPADPTGPLSGGEKMRVLLAGIALHTPSVVLLDEPTNHLDRRGRAVLCDYLSTTPATVLTVSHDRELLDIVDCTFELSRRGIRRYGGNYAFYRACKDIEIKALEDCVSESTKALEKARRTADEVARRRQKMDSRGGKKSAGEGIPRILAGGRRSAAQNSTSALAGKHDEKLEAARTRLEDLRSRQEPDKAVRIKTLSTGVHTGRIIFHAEGIGFNYEGRPPLWPRPLDLTLRGGDRILIEGGNGSGKSTLLDIITGSLQPTDGRVYRTPFSHARLDQEYTIIDDGLTLLGQLERFNKRNLPPDRLRTELDRYLFPAPVWDKHCGVLSGGEKMRLALCCILTADQAPDVLLLDEPTNNLDIRNIEILASAVRDYRGTLLLVTHDRRFAEDVAVSATVTLGDRG